jgi:hypothetical protein
MGEKSPESAISAASLAVSRAPADALAAYCPDLEQWPNTWIYEARDLLPGQQVVEIFKPFLWHLLGLKLSGKTLRKHRDNLWLLGGEIILDLHKNPKLRKWPMVRVVSAAVDDEGGPLISHSPSEDQQRSFDSTCRKFCRFLKHDTPGG